MSKQVQVEIYEQLARVGHALSNAHRLKMLNLLAHGEKTVDQLARETGQTKATASANLKVLRTAHLVESDKRGVSVHCRLASAGVAQLWLQLRDVGEAISPEVRELMRDQVEVEGEVSELSLEELKAQWKKGGWLLLDLRPKEEYEAGHLPGAINIPFSDLEDGVSDLPKRKKLLVYCRGPFCANAIAGNRWLRQQRYRAERLRFSVPEWNAAGFPVEKDPEKN